MQRAYDYRSGFADRAELAVEAYLTHEEATEPGDITQLVEWLAPDIYEKRDDNGKTRYINPGLYPYMWKNVEMIYDNGKFIRAVSIY